MGTFVKKHKKKFIVLAVIIAVLALLVFRVNKKVKALPVVEVTTLQKSDLTNAVNATGTIESEDSTKIYTQLTLPVDKNLVEVGDRVAEGDVLCQLDATTLENTIQQQRSAVGAQAAVNQNTIDMAKKQYDRAQENVDDAYDSTLFQAEQSVLTAEQAVEQAKYGLKQAEIALDGSVDGVQNARQTYKWSGEEDRTYLDQAINARDSAYNSYEVAKQNVADAEEMLAQAEEALELAQHGVGQQIDGYKDAIKSNEIAAGTINSQWVAIRHLEEDLKDAVITSPVAGVVTAIYVNEGATSTGLMYVIEDVGRLKVTTGLKEYDLASVSEGNQVEIKSDATGDKVFRGTLDSIAPTSTKDPTGENVIGGNPEFKTEITVSGNNPELRIGTKARMDIIYEQKKNVLNIGYEAIGQDEQGNHRVFVLEEEIPDSGVCILKAVPITLGMETDFSVEVVGNGLEPGMPILGDAGIYQDGDRVQLMGPLSQMIQQLDAENAAQPE